MHDSSTRSAFFKPQQHQKAVNETVTGTPLLPSASQVSSSAAGALYSSSAVSALPSSMQGPRGLRFPSSRRYLWDRTPAGAQVLINTQDHVPHVQVAASAFGAISRAAERQTGTVPLQLGISVTPTNQVTALVQELDPLVCKAGTYLQVTCPLSKHAQQQDAAAPSLRAALQAQLDQRSSARVKELYALSASAMPAAAPGERVCLQLLLQMPSCSMLATPLYTKRLCHVPLAEALLKPGGMAAWQSGFLSMDQARSLLPLEATDVHVYSMPLVGVWVKGPSSVLHPLVAAACLRFAFSSLLADRAVNPDSGAFLLLLCPEGDPVSKCYEVCPSDSSSLQLSSYQLSASISPAAALAQQCPGGMLKADWQLSSCQPQPLQGSFRAATANGSSAAPLLLTAPPAGSGTPPCRELYLPQPGVGVESPVLLLAHQQQQGYSSSSRLGELLPAARSSAPSAAGRFEGFAAQQHAAAAAARRSLPQTPGYGGLQPSNAPGTSSALYDAQGDELADGCRGARQGSSTNGRISAGRDDANGVWPQPRSSMPARPYRSPQPQQWQVPREQQQQQQMLGRQQQWQVPDHHHHQQQQQQQQDNGSIAGEVSQQGLVQLGEQLLQGAAMTGEATLAMIPCNSAHQQTAAAEGGVSRSNTSMSQQQQQQGWAAGGINNNNSSSSRPGTGMSWSERQQQQLRSSLDAAAASLSAARAGLNASVEAASRSGSPSKASAAAAGEFGSTGFGGLVTSTQQQQSTEVRPGTSGDTDCAPRLGSPVRPYRQQVAAGAGLAADAAAEASIYGSSGRGESSNSWRVHEVAPVSPSTRAGVALSNLSLLQQLSNGQLQAVLEEATSPHKQQQQLDKNVAQEWQQQQMEEVWQQQAQQQHWQQVELLQQQQPQDLNMQEVDLASAGHSMDPWPGAAANAMQRFAEKPQTPDTPHSAAAAAAEYAAAPLRSSMDATSNAAAALQAAAAAVHRMPPSPYGRTLGVQRYAADAAALCNSNSSQEYSLLVAGAWGGAATRQDDAATAGARSSTTRLYGASASPSSPCYARSDRDVTQQQLRGLLGVSAAAAAGTAAASGAAGEMLAPYNASSAGLAQQQVILQQQQQQQQGVLALGPVLDPVAQALQGEVQQLRQELMRLQQQLRTAGMPDPAALALPAPPPAVPRDSQDWQQQRQQQRQKYQQQQEQMYQQQQPQHRQEPRVQYDVHQQQQQQWMQQQGTSMHSNSSSCQPGQGRVAQPAGYDVEAAASAPEAELSLMQRPAAAENSSSSSSTGSETAVAPAEAPAAAAGPHAPAAHGTAAHQTTGGEQQEVVPNSALATVEHGSGGQPCSSSSGHVQVTASAADEAASAMAGQPAHKQQQQQPVQRYDPPQQQQERQQQQQQEERQQQLADEPRLPVLACRVMSPRLASRSPFAHSTSSDSGSSSSSAAGGEEATSGSTAADRNAAAQEAPAVTITGSSRSMPEHPAQCSPLRAPAAAASPVRKPSPSLQRPAAAAAAAAASAAMQYGGALRSSAARSSGGSVRGSRQLRGSLDVPPLVEVVRTKYCQASDDSDDSDREFEEKLMAKYGLKHH